MKNIPDAQQAEEFDRYIQHWQQVLSLNSWRIERVKKPAKDAMASVACDQEAKLATYRLGDFGATEINSESLSKTALHEILHVFLHDLIAGAQDSRTSDEHLSALEHGVINVLEKVLYEWQTSSN
jgi:hypothetical protein